MAAPGSDYSYHSVSFPAEHVAHVEINRPKALNAFHEAMWLELRQVFNALSNEPSIRAIVLSGAGPKAFSSGLDVKAASESWLASGDGDENGNGQPDPSRIATRNRRYVAEFQDCISAIEACAKPVICALHGYSFGLAIDIACAADVRICTEDVKFSIKEVDIGMAADIGTLSRLPKIVQSMSWVKEVAYTARIFGAQEAARVGFVSQVHPTKHEAVAAALQLAKLIASKSPVGVQGTKELLNYSVDHTVQEGLNYTAVWNSAMLQTADMGAALMGGIDKTKPVFAKL
ncbi:hypothetical protein KEM52_000117 [Ascosphaera acerosa]|nr:hypothetical protein KEM52_000117 [Ascosphaera acerosa]